MARVDRRLLLVGLDGATWKLIDPLLAAHKMPNLERLIAGGVRAPLETIRPTLSPAIWTTIATGVGPQTHGISWFTAPVPGTSRSLVVTSNLRRVGALWNILSGAGYRVGVLNWWATYPVEPVDGFLVSDQANAVRRMSYVAALGVEAGGPETPGDVWPASLGRQLDTVLRGNVASSVDMLPRFADVPPERLEALRSQKQVDLEDILSIFAFSLEIDRVSIEVALQTIPQFEPDFTAIYLNGLDAAEHHFRRYIEPDKFPAVPPEAVARYRGVIYEYYVYMDEVLGRLLELVPAERRTVVIVSDHGHEANPSYDPSTEDHYNRLSSGGHEDAPDGVLVLSGLDVVAGAFPVQNPTVFDVAPTVLALMGVPVARDMEGRVLSELLRPEFLAERPVRFAPSYAAGHVVSDVPIDSAGNTALGTSRASASS